MIINEKTENLSRETKVIKNQREILKMKKYWIFLKKSLHWDEQRDKELEGRSI